MRLALIFNVLNCVSNKLRRELGSWGKMSFYLSIPSDSSHEFFPNNKISSYTTKLAREIELYDDYEIGLSSIHFPLTYFNVQKNELRVFKVDKSVTLVSADNNIISSTEIIKDHLKSFYTIPEGRYNSETMVQEMFKKLPKKCFSVSVSKFNRRVTLKIEKENIAINEPLFQFFGGLFEPEPEFIADAYVFRKGVTYYGLNVIDYQRACHNIYIYCDLVSPRIVGHTQVSLLGTVANPVSGSFGETIVERFNPIRYFKLGKNRFDTIKIDLVSDTGTHIPFEGGKVFIEIHLRKFKRV